MLEGAAQKARSRGSTDSPRLVVQSIDADGEIHSWWREPLCETAPKRMLRESDVASGLQVMEGIRSRGSRFPSRGGDESEA
jgi:hypothetical protein